MNPWGSGCSAAVERIPSNIEVVGSIPAGYWAFFLLLSSEMSLNRSLEEVQDCNNLTAWNSWHMAKPLCRQPLLELFGSSKTRDNRTILFIFKRKGQNGPSEGTKQNVDGVYRKTFQAI